MRLSTLLLTTAACTLTIADGPDYMRPLCYFSDQAKGSVYTIHFANAGTNTTNGVDSAGECGNRFIGELEKRAEIPWDLYVVQSRDIANDSSECHYDGIGNACAEFTVDYLAMARVKKSYKVAFGKDIGCIKGGGYQDCDLSIFYMKAPGQHGVVKRH